MNNLTHPAKERLNLLRREHPNYFPALEAERILEIDLPPYIYASEEAGRRAYINSFDKLPVKREHDICGFLSLATWRLTQGIYIFDPVLETSIENTSLFSQLSLEMVQTIPEWCVYIQILGANYPNIRVSKSEDNVLGAWVHLNKYKDKVDLSIDIHLEHSFAIPSMNILLDRPLKKSIVDACNRYGIVEPLYMSRAVYTVEHILKLFLYICSQNADITHKNNLERPTNPIPIKTRRHGMKIFPPMEPKQWDVGVRLGAALKRAQERVSREESLPSGRNVRPHIRRAHWHTYVVGPRKEIEKQKRELKWLPPIAIKVSDYDNLPAVIHNAE